MAVAQSSPLNPALHIQVRAPSLQAWQFPALSAMLLAIHVHPVLSVFASLDAVLHVVSQSASVTKGSLHLPVAQSHFPSV